MPSKHTGKVRIDDNTCSPFNPVFLRMQGFLETICFDCLIVLLEIKPTGITLTTDCSCSGEGACRMIPNGSPVSQVQHLDAYLAPTSSPFRVRVTILVLVYFFETQSKESVWKKNSSLGWVVYILTSYLRPMTVFFESQVN